MNLIDVIKGGFSSEMIGKLGSAIGESPEKTKSALGASIPSILAGLVKLGSTSAGADQLHKTASPANLPPAGDLGSLLSEDTGALLQKGLAMLTAMFGEHSTEAIVASLSKYSGLSAESAKKLLGYVLPMVLSMIAGKAGGMNARGLADMLAGQKENIAKALPAGFSLPEAHRLASAPMPAAVPGMPKWLLPLVALAGLASAAVYLWPAAEPAAKNEGPAAAAAAAPESAPAPDAPKAKESSKLEAGAVQMPDPVALGKEFTSLFSTLTETLGGVKDVAAAEAALAALKESNGKLDGLSARFQRISATPRDQVIEIIKPGLDKLKELTTKVSAVPGVSEKLKPVMDEILNKLAGMAA